MIRKVDKELIELLNKAVARELQVSVQYMMQHTKMEKLLRKVINENILEEQTSYDTFGAYLKKISINEMKHLGMIMERVYLIGGETAATKPDPIKIGESMKEMAELNLKAEQEALELYDIIVRKAGELGDRETRRLFVGVYKDEEDHVIAFQNFANIENEPDLGETEESQWRSIFDEEYIKLLNKALWAETSAIVQYTNQHEMASKEELRKKKTPLEVIKDKNKEEIVSDLLKEVFMEEMDHFEKIAERIYEVDREALANVEPLPELGKNADDWIKLDRDAEDYAIQLYRQIIKKANDLGDVKTKKMFEDIIVQEEEHYWKFDDYLP